MVKTIKKECSACLRDFLVEKYRKNSAKYCSRACHNLGQTKNDIRKCINCTNDFVLKSNGGVGKYCSLKCCNEHKTEKRICFQCKKEFCIAKCAIRKGEGSGQCCSRKCATLYRWGTPYNRLNNQLDKTHSNGCWIFTGLKDKNGYGKILRNKSHRLSYELYYGDIPNGLMICHKCDNASCCNPLHLYAGTALDNAMDIKDKTRWKEFKKTT